MGDFWGLDEVMFCVFNRAEHALVLLEGYQHEIWKGRKLAYYGNLWIFIIEAHVANPFARTSVFTYDTVAVSMYRHPTLFARQVLIAHRLQFPTYRTWQHLWFRHFWCRWWPGRFFGRCLLFLSRGDGTP